MRTLLVALVVVMGAMVGGCSQRYVVPGGPAPLEALGLTPEQRSAMVDGSVARAQAKKPLVTFPATIAIARVQARDYFAPGYGGQHWLGQYSLISTRDVEKDEDFAAVQQLQGVKGAVTLKRILLQRDASSDVELREASAKLHANLLLFYTFDTQFYTEDRVRPLGVITLGLFPNKKARAICTASAVLMDVNNGYIYMVVEATSKDGQLANAWSDEQAMDDVRRKVERAAFEQMLKDFKAEWPQVVETYRTAAR